MAFIIATGPVTIGTNERDGIPGRPEMDIILARAGDDEVFLFLGGPGAGGGDDIVDAGDGDDGREFVVAGDEGNDVILGGPGRDDLAGGLGNDVIVGEEGDDRKSIGGGISGGPDDDFLFGSDGNDIIHAGLGEDTITGGPGSDLLFGVERRAPGTLTVFDGEPDVFQFNFGSGFGLAGEPSQGNDVIQFFEIGTDGIRVSGLAESLDTNGNGLLEDEDARVDVTSDGSLFVIDFNGVPLVDGGTAAGTLTLFEASGFTSFPPSLEVPRDILFV
jgi:Ca2+-binding RTX toxin-like protein